MTRNECKILLTMHECGVSYQKWLTSGNTAQFIYRYTHIYIAITFFLCYRHWMELNACVDVYIFIVTWNCYFEIPLSYLVTQFILFMNYFILHWYISNRRLTYEYLYIILPVYAEQSNTTILPPDPFKLKKATLIRKFHLLIEKCEIRLGAKSCIISLIKHEMKCNHVS